MRNFLDLECILFSFLYFFQQQQKKEDHLKFHEDILLISDDNFVIVWKGESLFYYFNRKSDTVKFNVI